MQDRERDLIVGVLVAQTGFLTPSEVLTAAAAGLVDAGSDSLLTRLERSGALNSERRKVLEALADQALSARNGDLHAVASSLSAKEKSAQLLEKGKGSPLKGWGAGNLGPPRSPRNRLQSPGPEASKHVAQVGTVRWVGEDRLLEIGCAKPRPDGEREDIDQLLRLRAEQMRT